MVRFKTSPLYSSILTLAPGAPPKNHVMVWLVPCCQLSKALGEIMLNHSVAVTEKLSLLQSKYDVLVVDVILIL